MWKTFASAGPVFTALLMAEPLPGNLLRPLDDLRRWLEAHPGANTDAVRQWVREFAEAAAMSDILEDFDKLLARRQQGA